MKNNSLKLTDKQRIEFTKQVEYFFEASRANWPKVLSFAFLKGVATGLGVFVGGTIVVALLLWIVSGVGEIPFLNNVTNSVEHTIKQRQEGP